MCGIAGICLGAGIERTEADYEVIRTEFTSLLVNCQVRGRDAAGAYVVNKDAHVWYYKAPRTATEIASDKKYWALMDKIGPDTVAVIGHTRAATTGSPKVNDNNHPIWDKPIIGVHNGVIYNHKELGRRYNKIAEVDSAAIMALLRANTTEKPLTISDLQNCLPELEGPFAIAVADVRKPDCVYLARNKNPVHFTRNTKLGFVAFASTDTILKATFGPATKTTAMPAHSVCRIDGGCMKKKIKFFDLNDGAGSTKKEEVCLASPEITGPGEAIIKDTLGMVFDQNEHPTPTKKAKSVMDKGRKCSIHGKKDCHELNHPLVKRMRIVRKKEDNHGFT